MSNILKLTFGANCESQTTNAATCPAMNLGAEGLKGHAIWTLDADPTNLTLWRRPPLMEDGTETVDLMVGYTKLCICPSGSKIWNRSEHKFYLGATYGALTVDEILAHADYQYKIFCEEKRDVSNIIIGITKVLVYDVAPTGECLQKIYDYLKIFFFSLDFSNGDNSSYSSLF